MATTGRPKEVSGNGVTLPVWVSEETKELVEQIAEHEGVSPSKFAREILDPMVKLLSNRRIRNRLKSLADGRGKTFMEALTERVEKEFA